VTQTQTLPRLVHPSVVHGRLWMWTGFAMLLLAQAVALLTDDLLRGLTIFALGIYGIIVGAFTGGVH
jgi:hypothetical protein